MTPSSKCVKLIAEFEGFMAKPYVCSGGVNTIGYGTTIYPNGKKVQMTDRAISVNEAEAYLMHDIQFFGRRVDKIVLSNVNQNQFDALVSFAYNVGIGNLTKSTLLRKVNMNPNDLTISNEFLKWNKAGSKVLNGLTRRRKAEATLYFEK